ncbi:MAG: 4Fe-4S binding protein [Candidatus Omnitrophica bacterium]|nr:4Fe-4S binding protein [Candidatus Omnitrophota bacterium]
MNRFELAKYLLNEKKFFKLVCGAGNEDAEEVRRLVFVYALAGAKCFDVSANVDVVKHAVLGIEEAIQYAEKLGREIKTRPFINVSIGMRGDPHVRKATITEKCTKCGACVKECPTDAITGDLSVIEAKCIGCGNCESACNYDAISFYHKDKDLKSLLEECRACGAEQFELHAAVSDSSSILEEWTMVNEVIDDNYVSMCLDRLHLGDSQLRRRIRDAQEIAGGRFIVQADGVPMSGGNDDYNTTLQAIAIADIVMKSKLPVKVLLSGGTNSLTARFADMCGVAYNGVSIGTFARNLVKELINQDDFMRDGEKIKQAVEIADKLITDNIGERIW